jgi:hypothetical protein
MERIGGARNDRATLLLGHWLHAHVRLSLGELNASHALFEQCHGLQEPANRAVYAAVSAEDPYTGMLVSSAVTLAHLGYPDQVRHRVDEALAEARRLKNAYTLGFVLGNGELGTLAQWLSSRSTAAS